ncbi:hypothetical protein ACFVSS_17410 [Peribacillus butanolivorans]|uniref:hypothetical protein n=1 Tax=Peribacillus butanolivorans TaxID=421767 RepID=UPI0036DD11F6
MTDVVEFQIIELPVFIEEFIKNNYEIQSPEGVWWLLLTSVNKKEVNEVIYNKTRIE